MADPLQLTNVDSECAYHNWLEVENIPHSPEREQAFTSSWHIISNFIAGPEQKSVDWSVVCEAYVDATDIDGVSPDALSASFRACGLAVVHVSLGAQGGAHGDHSTND